MENILQKKHFYFRRRKGKVIFLVSGQLIGIATIVTLINITQSMSRDVEGRLDQFGANIVMAPRSENLSLSYAIAWLAIPLIIQKSTLPHVNMNLGGFP